MVPKVVVIIKHVKARLLDIAELLIVWLPLVNNLQCSDP